MKQFVTVGEYQASNFQIFHISPRDFCLCEPEKLLKIEKSMENFCGSRKYDTKLWASDVRSTLLFRMIALYFRIANRNTRYNSRIQISDR